MTEKPFVADTSHYSGTVTSEMLEGFAMVIAKGGGNESGIQWSPFDAKFAQTVDAAFHTRRADGRIGIPCGMYWFICPRVYTDRGMRGTLGELTGIPNERHIVLGQIERALKAGVNGWKAVSSIWFDVEEASLNSSGQRITAVMIRDTLDDLYARMVGKMDRGDWPRYRLGIYSRKSWFTEYDKGGVIEDWVRGHTDLGIWVADYRVYDYPAYRKGSDIRTQPRSWLSKVPESFGVTEKRGKEWHLWQFWGHGWADLNVWNGSEGELLDWVGYTPRGEAHPEPESPPASASSGGGMYLSAFERVLEELGALNEEERQLQAKLRDLLRRKG